MKEEVKEICKSDMSKFISLHQQSLYLQGARDLLLRLQNDHAKNAKLIIEKSFNGAQN